MQYIRPLFLYKGLSVFLYRKNGEPMIKEGPIFPLSLSFVGKGSLNVDVVAAKMVLRLLLRGRRLS